MQSTYRSRLLASTLFVGAAVAAAPAFAQDADPANQPKTGVQSSDPAAPAAGISSQDAAPPATESSAGEIVVTGTLVRNPNLVSSSPIAVLGQEEVALRQSNTAEDLLRSLPGAVPSIGSSVNNGNGGASYVDLRGLGSFRNLALLDGNRVVPSDTIGRVDLNNIPLALIERTEVLTGGAATTYGADAVSGVVNFITRSDFSGIEINASEGITEQGDGETTRVDVTIGGNFNDDRGNVVFSVGYQNRDPIYQGDREYGLNTYTSTSGGSGGSGRAVPGRFTLGTNNRQIDTADGTLKPLFAPFNFNPYNLYQTPFERFNIYGAGHYDMADNVEVYTRGMYSKNTVSTIVAPSGLFDNILVIPVSSPFLPAPARAQFCANNDFDFNTVGTQTLTPAQCQAAALATNPNDPNFRAFSTGVGRRAVEVGPRVSDYVTQVFDYRAGVKVGLTDKINLDLSGSYGESENTQTIQGYVLTSRIRTAAYSTSATTCNLGASPTVLNPANGLTLAESGASPTAGSGCVPVNLFGDAGSISPAAVSYLTGNSQVQQKASLAQARALLSGDLGFGSPASDEEIGFALGGEFRRYRASQTADLLAQTPGELGGFGGAVPNFTGGYQVYEGYGEIIAPIVNDRPFFKSLTLEAGARYSHYNVQGGGGYNTTTYKGGGSWEPADGIKLRGNYQHAVRAPNINELFAPQNTVLTNLATDPCAGTRPTTGPNATNLRAICLAQGAPAASIGTIANPVSAQGNGTFSGGTYLKPEKADSYTFGVVLRPDFLRGFSVSVDYYHIRIKDAISQPLPGQLVNACFGDGLGATATAAAAASPACALFRRNPVTGSLDGDSATTPGLIFPASNSGSILTDGIDVTINYRRDFGFAKLNLSFDGNWTNRSSFQSSVPGSVIPPGYPGAGTPAAVTDGFECTGLYSPNCGSPGSAGPNGGQGSLQPEFSWNQRTTLTFGSTDVSLLWRHVDKMKAAPETVTFVGALSGGALDGRTVNFSEIKAYDIFDAAGRVGVSDNLDLTLTVTNLLNKKPPLVGSTIGSTTFNSGNTYPSTYDTLGRRYTVGARVKF